jgi:hypothetical protein
MNATTQANPVYQAQRKGAELKAQITPDKCGLCRSPVTMTKVLRCRRCGRQCCPKCVVAPGAPVNCKGCE